MLAVALLYACKPGIPKDIIQPDQMRKVLFDIHVVDGYITTITNSDSAKLVASSYYKGIYKKFGIDSALYAKSMEYYYNHPAVMEKIYEQLEKTFVKEKAKNDKVVAAEAAREQEKANAQLNPVVQPKYLNVKEAGPIKSGVQLEANPFGLAR